MEKYNYKSFNYIINSFSIDNSYICPELRNTISNYLSKNKILYQNIQFMIDIVKYKLKNILNCK